MAAVGSAKKTHIAAATTRNLHHVRWIPVKNEDAGDAVDVTRLTRKFETLKFAVNNFQLNIAK